MGRRKTAFDIINTVKERIEEHEDISTEITQSETQPKREKVK